MNEGAAVQGKHCYLRCYGYSPAVFVGWLVVVDWNHSLIFALGQLITILSHKLQRSTDQRQMTHSEPHFYALSVRWLSAQTLRDEDDKSDVS